MNIPPGRGYIAMKAVRQNVYHTPGVQLRGSHTLTSRLKEGGFGLTDRDAAQLWILMHQLSQRNLNNYQKGVVALKMQPGVAKAAKERQRASGGAVAQISAQPKGKGKRTPETRAEIAEAVGLRHDTIEKIEVLQEKASELLPHPPAVYRWVPST